MLVSYYIKGVFSLRRALETFKCFNKDFQFQISLCFLLPSYYNGIRATTRYPKMADGTRAQEIRRLEDSFKQLKETSDQHSTDLKKLARVVP